ncbi:hypothetical protein IWZ03DRAFT_407656 [Phyllosticta citriasiana]|uniref:Uncharacterized protein n=1 Tax=Phyllosticta citriasiana TaxID=595635 RepID=A0ABR1KHH1_9PEZI
MKRQYRSRTMHLSSFHTRYNSVLIQDSFYQAKMDRLVEFILFPGRIFTGAIWAVQVLWGCYSQGSLDPAPAITSPAYLTILKPDVKKWTGGPSQRDKLKASYQDIVLVVGFYQSRRHRVSVIPQTISEYKVLAAQALWNILFSPSVIEPVVFSEPRYLT